MTTLPEPPSVPTHELSLGSPDPSEGEVIFEIVSLTKPNLNDLYNRVAADVLPLNKAAIFDALAGLLVVQVVVHFDGYGDSGQVESIVATNASSDGVALDGVQVTFHNPVWNEPEPAVTSMEIKAAIEEIAYDLLGHHYGGWQDGDGSFGDFHFDVTARTVRLEIDERVSSTEYSEIEC